MSPRIRVQPPLLNSATPWATTRTELTALYNCPHTGGVTTRTCLLDGFPNNPRIHQHTLFGQSSLNTYGYSPRPLAEYLADIKAIVEEEAGLQPQKKPFIVSVTGSATEVAQCVAEMATFGKANGLELWAEINLSCPNIPGKPPPAYSAEGLTEYLTLLPEIPEIPVGLKTPPYTYSLQYENLLSVLKVFSTTISFLTATNTLGSSLHLSSPPSLSVDAKKIYQPTLSSATGTGVGGLAGEAIHCLSLGNVDTLRRGLDAVGLHDIVVIGVGGVSDKDGMLRMLAVGASAVEVGTALGREGVGVFQKVLLGEKQLGGGIDGEGVFVEE